MHKEDEIKIKIPYGKEEIQVNIPKENVKDIIYPNKVEKRDPDKLVNYALDNPIGMESFDEFLSKNRNILFIVNDGTRPTPTASILKILDKRMDLIEAKYIIATGIHSSPTEEEYSYIFGELYDELKSKIIVHDGMKEENLVYKGLTKNDTEMWINKNVYEAGSLIPIGSVEPHYFGGFTGGRKFLLPGLSGYKTIEQNHRLVLRDGVETLKLEGNPVHEDFIDALKTLKGKPIFSIQTVLNREKNLYAATAGDINESFYEAIKFAKEVFCVSIKEKADIVVTVAPYPMDVDLYQSLKATDYGKLALKENGILILVSKCRNGIGPSKFYELLSSSNSLKEVFDVVTKEYKLGYHIAAKIAELNSWAKMWGVTQLEDEIMRKAFIRPFSSIQNAIDEAINFKGKNAKIIFLMDGSITVPIIQ
jgi:nickel-dependent lactate racemase